MSPFGLFYSLYVNVFCSFQVGLASVCQSFHLQNNPGIRRAVCSVSIKLLFSFRSELPAHYFSSNQKQLCSNTKKKTHKNYRSRTHDIIIKTISTETLQSSCHCFAYFVWYFRMWTNEQFLFVECSIHFETRRNSILVYNNFRERSHVVLVTCAELTNALIRHVRLQHVH